MEKIYLTEKESRIIKAFGQVREAFVPQLAVTARLTPSEVTQALSGLEHKVLVEHPEPHFARLTPKGVQARLNWYNWIIEPDIST